MKTIKNESIVMWDVDDTLVLHKHSSKKGTIKIKDNTGEYLHLKPHKLHIKVLKDHKLRGFTNIVWSGGGYKWAKKVVKALGLSKYVDIIMTKPCKFFDDLPSEQVLVGRVYLPDVE